MVPLTIPGLRSDRISVETLLHMKMFMLIFFFPRTTTKCKMSAWLHANLNVLIKLILSIYLGLAWLLLQVMGLLGEWTHSDDPLPKALLRMMLHCGCTTVQFILPSSKICHSQTLCSTSLSIHSWTAYPAVLRWEVGYILDESLAHHRANRQRETSIHTHIHTWGQCRVTSTPTVSPQCLWTVGGSRSTRRELTQTLGGTWKLHTKSSWTPERF